MRSDVSIVPYDAARHEGLLHGLWLRSLAGKWAVERSLLHMLFSGTGSGFVVVDRKGFLGTKRLVGFAGTIPAEHALAAILVEPESRRRGIGTSLLRAALSSMHGAGRVAIGGLSSLWKGVPTELTAAIEFFRAHGCSFTKSIVDQYRELDDFRYPRTIEEDVHGQGLRLHRADTADAAGVIDFEREHFPHWAQFFRSCIDAGRYADIACLSSGSGIVGAALLGRPGTTFPGSQWSALARRGLGMYATLGIDPAYRGRGLGYALSAFATRCVRDDGAAVCFINYSEAVPLYRKLGFRDWAEYQAAEMAI